MKGIAQNALVTAIVAAVVGGVFTLAPIAYDWVTKRQLITYDTVSSGVLNADTDKQIYFIDVSNEGSSEVESVEINYKLDGNNIADFTLDTPFGVKTEHVVSGSEVTVQVGELNPSESVRFAFLAEGDLSGEEGVLSIRARGLSSDKIVERTDEADGLLGFLDSPFDTFVLLMGYAAVVMFVLKLKGWRRGGGGQYLDRDVELRYIRLLCGEAPELKSVDTSNITYAGFSDVVYLSVFNGNLSKEVGLKALGCLSRCQMASESKATVERHISQLLGEEADEFVRSCNERSEDERGDFEKIFASTIAS